MYTILLPLHVLYLEITYFLFCLLYEAVSSLKASILSYLSLCWCPWAAPGSEQALSKCLYCLGSQCDGALRRDCGSDPGFWRLETTGGIYAGHVGANSVGSLLQEWETFFVKESESIPVRNYSGWLCVHVCTPVVEYDTDSRCFRKGKQNENLSFAKMGNS